MKIDVVISADYIKEDYIKGKIVVVIDMLRATSVMTTALGNGAKMIIPTLTVEEAFEKKKELDGKALLGGEREAKRIEGFDFSNSPLEFTKENVDGKIVVMSTTNGTRALTLSSNADTILIAAMLNAKATAKKLIKLNKDIVIINAGTNGAFSLDDFICGGYIISEIEKSTSCDLTDIAKAAKDIYDKNSNVEEYIKNATHYEVLKSLNLEADIEYCCKKDLLGFAAIFKDNKIEMLLE